MEALGLIHKQVDSLRTWPWPKVKSFKFSPHGIFLLSTLRMCDMIFQGYSVADCRWEMDKQKHKLEDLHTKLHC